MLTLSLGALYVGIAYFKDQMNHAIGDIQYILAINPMQYIDQGTISRVI